jgi:hypothetical protein
MRCLNLLVVSDFSVAVLEREVARAVSNEEEQTHRDHQRCH